jgi:hypothetical protein
MGTSSISQPSSFMPQEKHCTLSKLSGEGL